MVPVPAPALGQEQAERALERELDVAFAPLHKRCLGVAAGLVLGGAVLALTLVHLWRSPEEPYPLILLQQYFIGYTVTPLGALVGAAWGFWVGFVLGWTFGFARNLVLSATAFALRARAELAQGRGFLDEI